MGKENEERALKRCPLCNGLGWHWIKCTNKGDRSLMPRPIIKGFSEKNGYS